MSADGELSKSNDSLTDNSNKVKLSNNYHWVINTRWFSYVDRHVHPYFRRKEAYLKECSRRRPKLRKMDSHRFVVAFWIRPCFAYCAFLEKVIDNLNHCHTLSRLNNDFINYKGNHHTFNKNPKLWQTLSSVVTICAARGYSRSQIKSIIWAFI